jgi:hypothetical protein
VRSQTNTLDECDRSTSDVRDNHKHCLDECAIA